LGRRRDDGQMAIYPGEINEAPVISKLPGLARRRGQFLPGSTHIKLVSCNLVRLDDVVTEPVGFIKIDVEGHEIAVFEGAQRMLNEHKPILLIESERRHNA
jgi:FkbM family methyltransferase